MKHSSSQTYNRSIGHWSKKYIDHPIGERRKSEPIKMTNTHQYSLLNDWNQLRFYVDVLFSIFLCFLGVFVWASVDKKKFKRNCYIEHRNVRWSNLLIIFERKKNSQGTRRFRTPKWIHANVYTRISIQIAVIILPFHYGTMRQFLIPHSFYSNRFFLLVFYFSFQIGIVGGAIELKENKTWRQNRWQSSRLNIISDLQSETN